MRTRCPVLVMGLGLSLMGCSLTPHRQESISSGPTTTSAIRFETVAPTTLSPLPSNAGGQVSLAPAKTLCEPIPDLSVEFASGSPDLTDTTDGIDLVVSRLAKLKEAGEHATVTIIGHTDSVPERDFPGGNDGLSTARAQTVVDEIKVRGGDKIDVSMLAEPSGVADTAPLVSPEVTDADRAQNRRVEVQFRCG